MITVTVTKDHGMKVVDVVKDGRQIAHREFRSGRLATAYAMMYDKNYKRIK